MDAIIIDIELGHGDVLGSYLQRVCGAVVRSVGDRTKIYLKPLSVLNRFKREIRFTSFVEHTLPINKKPKFKIYRAEVKIVFNNEDSAYFS